MAAASWPCRVRAAGFAVVLLLGLPAVWVVELQAAASSVAARAARSLPDMYMDSSSDRFNVRGWWEPVDCGTGLGMVCTFRLVMGNGGQHTQLILVTVGTSYVTV